MQPCVAFVLGGGGVLGASQVGMLRALFEHGVRPDVVLGTSVGALNGAVVASDPTPAAVERLTELWLSLSGEGVFSDSLFGQAARLARAPHPPAFLRPVAPLLAAHLPVTEIEELAVRFQCVAASIERATAHWFDSGRSSTRCVASCAVPGLFPPARVGSEHFLDGGLVSSIPFGRALRLDAHRGVCPSGRAGRAAAVAAALAVGGRAGRLRDRPAGPVRRGSGNVPEGTTVHVLPTGGTDTPLVSLRYRSTSSVHARIENAYQAGSAYLAGGPGPDVSVPVPPRVVRRC